MASRSSASRSYLGPLLLAATGAATVAFVYHRGKTSAAPAPAPPTDAPPPPEAVVPAPRDKKGDDTIDRSLLSEST